MSAVLELVHDDQALPSSVDAEANVLGALMHENASLAKVSDWLRPEDFMRSDHSAIYRAILHFSDQRKPFDSVTLMDKFTSDGDAETSGYVIHLQSTSASSANLVAYAEIVREKSRLRSLVEIGNRVAVDAMRNGQASDIAALAGHDLMQLGGDARAGGLTPASSGLGAWYADLSNRYERGDAVTGLPYPWADVNSVTHGLQPGELTIIAARPSMGKSVMGLNLATFSAMRDVNTAFFSLEMTTTQVNRRNIASLSEVDHEWLLAPSKGHEENWTRVADAVKQLKSAPLLVDDSAGLRTEQVVARLRRAHMQKPVELIVLDHLHDMDFPGKREMRHEVGHAVGEMKKLAKEFNCPAVVLAQLSRGVESRNNKRPMMSDLRESGEIEQKADVIWFLYREDYYQRTTGGYVPQYDVELILGKGRDLRVGEPVILRADFHHMALRDWEGAKPMRNSDGNKGSSRGMA